MDEDKVFIPAECIPLLSSVSLIHMLSLSWSHGQSKGRECSPVPGYLTGDLGFASSLCSRPGMGGINAA